ncbi:hypothetical protein BDF19DRAFT_411647 [Syncephalis fuscata]|nr:hypothetical protein BDF19DRAFT_411647 [Syncephalis fuscata]
MPKRDAWKSNLHKQGVSGGGNYGGRSSQTGGASGALIHCFGCNTEKARNYFNATQLAKMAQKKRPPLCLQCSNGGGGGSSTSNHTSASYAKPTPKPASSVSGRSNHSSGSGGNQSMIRSTVNHNPIPTQICSYCSELKPKTAYNATQWKKREYATCQECMDRFEDEADADHIHNLTAERFTYDPDADIASLPVAPRSARRGRNSNMTEEVPVVPARTSTTPEFKDLKKDKVKAKVDKYDSDYEAEDDFKDYGIFGYGNSDYYYSDTMGNERESLNIDKGKDIASSHAYDNDYDEYMDDGYNDYR